MTNLEIITWSAIALIAIVALTAIWPNWISKAMGLIDPYYDYDVDEHEDVNRKL